MSGGVAAHAEAHGSDVGPPLIVGRCAGTRLPLRAVPRRDAEQVTEALPGEPLHVLAVPPEHPGWARAATTHDGYAGWVPVGAVLPGAGPAPGGAEPMTVTALRAHAFAAPTVSSAIVAELCLGARVWPRLADSPAAPDGLRDSPADTLDRWVPVILSDGEPGWLAKACLTPLSAHRTRRDRILALALRFLETPYVWGGRSAWGLDCSGLVQLVWGACGIPLPRDSDDQQAALQPTTTPARGDLAFFPGHVGILLDRRRLLHANARHMRVTIDVLGESGYGAQLADTCTGYGRLP